MNAVDDAKLLQMAREPDTELLPSGRQAAGLWPLIVLLAFVPSLFAFRHFAPGDVMSEEGLRALQLVSGGQLELPVEGIAEIGPGTGRITPLDGLTALALRLELFAPETRLLLVSYFSSVVLLLSLASFMGQTSGPRAKLIAVLLASLHPKILGMSGYLPTTTLAVALALWASSRLDRHRQQVRWLTWSLFGSGIAWGLSRLISESFTVATAILLASQCLLKPCRSTKSDSGTQPICWGTWLLGSAGCLAVVAIMMSLTVAVWDIALLRPAGRTQEWLRFSTSGLIDLSQWRWPRDLTIGELCRETLTTCGPLLGFALLGLADAIRTMRFCRRDPASGSVFLVLFWSVAGLLALLTWPSHRGDFSGTGGQPLFWLIANLMLAAHGIEAVIERRFGLEVVMWVAALGVLSLIFPTRWVRSLGLAPPNWIVAIVVAGAIIGIGSWWLQRAGWSATTRRRWLLACLMMTLLAELAWGIRSFPRPAADERELTALRRQIGFESSPDEPVLICDEPPPARLLFFVQTLCPDSPIRLLSEWEPESNHRRESRASQLIFSWGRQRSMPETHRDGRRLVPVSSPHTFQGRPLRAFRWTWRTVGSRKPGSDETATGLVSQP